MIRKGNLWHEKLSFEQIENAAQEDLSSVLYNLHEDILCLKEESAELKAELGKLNMEAVHYQGLLCGGETINKIKADEMRQMILSFARNGLPSDNWSKSIEEYANNLEGKK
ncbi:MAG: hypothetical protein GY799_16910 [Desulfobulbaceae bacterium]|nr:hypothetical protein [Desulfobulbaceae bacterium]